MIDPQPALASTLDLHLDNRALIGIEHVRYALPIMKPSEPCDSCGLSIRIVANVLITHMLSMAVADQHRHGSEALLRRQSVYLLSFDKKTRTRDWLLDEYRRVVRSSRLDAPAGWVAVRSAAIALTRYGDKDPLLSFVAAGLRDHSHEVANLNYWAYWLGEVADIHVDDSFMGNDDPIRWDGSQLLTHLANRIGPHAEQLELNVRTLWQLLLARPHLLAERPGLRSLVIARVGETLDCDDLGKQVRQELSDVAYAVRLSKR